VITQHLELVLKSLDSQLLKKQNLHFETEAHEDFLLYDDLLSSSQQFKEMQLPLLRFAEQID